MIVAIERNPLGPRLWLGSHRCHHGAVGTGLVAIGVGLCVHDRRDVLNWFRGNPGPTMNPAKLVR